jgi:hypothetical protein
MTRSVPVLIAAAVAFGCSPAKPSTTLHVVASSAKDDSGACIGVVGFTATLTGASASPVAPQLRSTPVLSDSQCGLDPLVIDSIGTDTPLTVAIDGLDSAGRERVGGNIVVGVIGASASETVTLTSQLTPVEPVLVVDRTALIAAAGGTARLADIQQMVVETTTGSAKTPVLAVSVSKDMAPYFQASEPGAFSVNVWNPAQGPPPAGYGSTLADGEVVTVTFTTSQGSLSIPRRTIRYNRFADTTFAYFEIQ